MVALKKDISVLEYKIKDQEHSNNLTNSNLQSRLNNAQQELKDKNVLLK